MSKPTTLERARYLADLYERDTEYSSDLEVVHLARSYIGLANSAEPICQFVEEHLQDVVDLTADSNPLHHMAATLRAALPEDGGDDETA